MLLLPQGGQGGTTGNNYNTYVPIQKYIFLDNCFDFELMEKGNDMWTTTNELLPTLINSNILYNCTCSEKDDDLKCEKIKCTCIESPATTSQIDTTPVMTTTSSLPSGTMVFPSTTTQPPTKTTTSPPSSNTVVQTILGVSTGLLTSLLVGVIIGWMVTCLVMRKRQQHYNITKPL